MNRLTRLFGAIGLALGAMRSPSRSMVAKPTVSVAPQGAGDEMEALFNAPARTFFKPRFDRQNHKQGKRFKSQLERSRRRK